MLIARPAGIGSHSGGLDDHVPSVMSFMERSFGGGLLDPEEEL